MEDRSIGQVIRMKKLPKVLEYFCKLNFMTFETTFLRTIKSKYLKTLWVL